VSSGKGWHCSAAEREGVEYEVVDGGGKFSREAGGTWSVWPGKENRSESCSVVHSCIRRKPHQSVVLGG